MTIKIPESLNDITLRQWQKFDAVNKEGSDEDFLIDKMIEIFCNVELIDVAKIPFKDAEEIYKDLVDVLKEEATFEPIITLDGVDYGFIPNLDDISLGEFVDLDTYLLDTKSLHKAMAVLYRPITMRSKELYRIEDYESSTKYSEVFANAPVSYATGAVVFFYSLSNELTKLSLSSSLKTILKETKEFKKTIVSKANSLKNTDGFNQFMPYVKEMLRDLRK